MVAHVLIDDAVQCPRDGVTQASVGDTRTRLERGNGFFNLPFSSVGLTYVSSHSPGDDRAGRSAFGFTRSLVLSAHSVLLASFDL